MDCFAPLAMTSRDSYALNPATLADRSEYPQRREYLSDEAMQKKLFVIQARDPATQRIINRLWIEVKAGK
jgi:putrescine transport system substrate-binding protein